MAYPSKQFSVIVGSCESDSPISKESVVDVWLPRFRVKRFGG